AASAGPQSLALPAPDPASQTILRGTAVYGALPRRSHGARRRSAAPEHRPRRGAARADGVVVWQGAAAVAGGEDARAGAARRVPRAVDRRRRPAGFPAPGRRRALASIRARGAAERR